MVDYPIGDLIAERVRAMGVTPFYKRFKHDGVARPEHGDGLQRSRPRRACAVVFYNRCNEAAALLKPGDFDWKAIFAAGVRWFHSGGIFAALSETTAELIIEGDAGGQGGRRRSSRSTSTTARSCGAPPAAPTRAVAVLGRIVEHVDVLVGNEEDLQKGLGIPGPEVAADVQARPERVLRHDRQGRRAAIRSIKVVATTLREVHSTNRHTWGAVAWIDGQTLRRRRPASSTSSIASAAATASRRASSTACSTGETPEEAVQLGWAHGALLTTFPGDTTMATLDQVRAFAKGGSARIQR